jgi:hypothetical protein
VGVLTTDNRPRKHLSAWSAVHRPRSIEIEHERFNFYVKADEYSATGFPRYESFHGVDVEDGLGKDDQFLARGNRAHHGHQTSRTEERQGISYASQLRDYGR